MITAALDTSNGIALAVAEDDHIIINQCHRDSGRHGEQELTPWLHELLSEQGLGCSNVVRWTVGTGPGSFSGIRVGIAMVQGICAMTAGAFRGVPTSLALATAASHDLKPGDRIGVLHDARRGQLIVTIYGKTTAGITAVRPACIPETPAELTQELAACARLITLHPEAVQPLLDGAARQRLITAEHVDASALLDPADCPWPDTQEEMEDSCHPVYVRPPVFVKPRPAPEPTEY